MGNTLAMMCLRYDSADGRAMAKRIADRAGKCGDVDQSGRLVIGDDIFIGIGQDEAAFVLLRAVGQPTRMASTIAATVAPEARGRAFGIFYFVSSAATLYLSRQDRVTGARTWFNIPSGSFGNEQRDLHAPKQSNQRPDVL